MKKEQILNEVEKYFKQEFESAQNLVNNPPFWLSSKKKMIDASIHRCLGVAQFIQHIGVSFAEVNVIYDETREKLENLLLTNE